MAVFNVRRREINAKIVYYGPGLSGKTTNLQVIHQRLRPEHKGKLMTLATQTDRTLFFDFLPVELGEVRGLKTRFQLYTVPGQVFYNATRKLVLKNVDGVVFVADSRRAALDDNIDSLKNLEENLAAYNVRVDEIPIVIQYNKRDLDEILPVEELQRHLNPRGWPYFEAIASKGVGVLETLTTICKLVIRNLRQKDLSQYTIGEATGPDPAAGVPATAAPTATAPAPASEPAAHAEAEAELEEAEEIEVLEEEPVAEPEPAPQRPATAPAASWSVLQRAAPTWDGQRLVLRLELRRGDEHVPFEIELALRLPTSK